MKWIEIWDSVCVERTTWGWWQSMQRAGYIHEGDMHEALKNLSLLRRISKVREKLLRGEEGLDLEQVFSEVSVIIPVSKAYHDKIYHGRVVLIFSDTCMVLLGGRPCIFCLHRQLKCTGTWLDVILQRASSAHAYHRAHIWDACSVARGFDLVFLILILLAMYGSCKY